MSKEWYEKHCKDNQTDGFQVWWVGYYGTPEGYDSSVAEQEEYWLRKGVALAGWHAHLETNKVKITYSEATKARYPNMADIGLKL